MNEIDGIANACVVTGVVERESYWVTQGQIVGNERWKELEKQDYLVHCKEADGTYADK